MNRTIKFRAQRLDNSEWVYGDLEHNPGKKLTRIHSYDTEGNYEGQHIVAPDTVGQFSGLLDCKGKEIYEGDIIQFVEFPQSEICYIKWCDINGMWTLAQKGRTNETNLRPLGEWIYRGVKLKIIGNIHEHRNLLTRGFYEQRNKI